MLQSAWTCKGSCFLKTKKPTKKTEQTQTTKHTQQKNIRSGIDASEGNRSGVGACRASQGETRYPLRMSGDHRRRHQRQGINLRHARIDPCAGRLSRWALYVAASAALQ